MTAPAYLDPTSGLAIGYKATKGTTAEPFLVPMAWQPSTLSYVTLTVDAAGALNVVGAGGGGGAVTIADGADIAEGATTDAAWSSGNGTVVALLKRLAGSSPTSLPRYDYTALVQAALTDTWTFKTGGAGGATVATVTIAYTDTGKLTISTVTIS